MPFDRLAKENIVEEIIPMHNYGRYIFRSILISVSFAGAFSILMGLIVALINSFIGASSLNAIFAGYDTMVSLIGLVSLVGFIVLLTKHNDPKFWITNSRVVHRSQDSDILALPLENITNIVFVQNKKKDSASLKLVNIGRIKYKKDGSIALVNTNLLCIDGLTVQKARSLQQSLGKLVNGRKKNVGNKVLLI